MADLSSILGGMVQGFKDFGTGLVDFFGTGAANIGDIASSIATGRATTKNQDDFRKWLYQTDDKQDAAAKGLGTILNGVSTVADVIPGAQAVTANPLFNGLQGAIGGVSDELKMAGKDADWGRAAQRAGVGAASGLASAYAGQGLAKTGNKLLSNGLTRGAVSGALGGGIANAGYTGIEGGSVQDMINAGLYGAQTGALVGGTTGLARELIKPAHKMDVALTDDEKAARIANIDDQLGKLDLNTPEGNARYAELTAARENYEPKTYYHGSPETDITEFDINRAGKNTRSGEKAIYFTDTPEAAEEFAYERIPTDSIFMDKVGKRGGVYEANLDMRNTLDLDNLTDAQIRELWNYASPLGQLDGQEAFVQRLTDWRDKYHNPQLTKGYIDLEALRNSPYDSFSATMYPNTGNKAREYAIFDASKAKITKSPKTVADLMTESKPKTIYHGTNAVFEDFDESLPSVWFTDNADDIANTGLSNKGGKINIMERELPNNLKLADWDLADRLTKQQLIDRGYDGIAYTESGTSGKDTYYEIFKPNKTLKKIGKAPQKTVADLMLSPDNGQDAPVMADMTTKNRNWDELYEQLSNEAGAFENENRTPITATPEQLQNRITEIDAKYGNDLPDEAWDERYSLIEQQRALENGYSSPYDYYVGESKKRFIQDFEANPDKYKQKMDAIEKQNQAQAALEEDIKNASPRKLAQFQLIQKKNPAPNDTLTWIRSPKEILTWDEAITGHRNGTDEAFSWPDYSLEDALRDQKRNRMTVYSSYPVKGGAFVTPSYQQASDYAGGGKVYSKVIRPNDVAWINGDEGQYAYTRVKANEASDIDKERKAR